MDRSLGAAFLIRAPERLAIDGDDIGAEFRERGDPGDEAILEGFGIERCKQIAQLVMGRRAVLEGPEPAQEVELPLAELGDLDPAVGASQYRQQALQQHLVQRILHLAALARILEFLEMLQPFNDLIVSAFDLRLGLGPAGPSREFQRTSIDLAFFRLVTCTLMRLPWRLGPPCPFSWVGLNFIGMVDDMGMVEDTLGRVPIITSLPPRMTRFTEDGREIGADYQRQCAASWSEVGFSPIISVNSKRELEAAPELRSLVSELGAEVIPVERDASAITGKPYVFVSDILRVACEVVGSGPFAMINADILLAKEANLIGLITSVVEPRRFLMARRIGISEPNERQGRAIPYGVRFLRCTHPRRGGGS